MSNKHLYLSIPLAASVVIASCEGDTIPVGLGATPPGTGPQVVFDLTRRPLPEIPLPNDVATFPDPTSRTGLRVNASLVAPTHMELIARQGLDTMEGWGTDEAITVAFAPEPGADPTQAALDLENVRSRMQGDDEDFSNDPVYLVNLTTGLPVPLDAGDGNFPAVLSDLGAAFPNDVKALEQNLLFESVEEGVGLSQSDYKPSLDLDFDGVLDHPNFLGAAKQWPGVDNLLTWYERQTNTLILRPLLPLEEKTAYAVVLTDRLTGPDGQPVRSPFPFVYHPSQSAGIGRLAGALGDRSRVSYFGDMAGSGLDHVSFAWTFTTQPVHEDMQILRDGLSGQGPFARFQSQFPAEATLYEAAGLAVQDSDEPPGWQTTPACVPVAGHPYTVFVDHFASALDSVYGLFGYSGTTLALLDEEATNIDHLVIGTFPSPYLLGDPTSADPDTQFHLDFKTGAGDVTQDEVHFVIAVPKTNAAKGFKQPFPVTFWGHGWTGADDEVLLEAGHFAKQGIAMIGFDYPEHGRVITAGDLKIATGLLTQSCLTPWITGLTSGRAHDLNGDGIADSGGLWWTAHVFHTRDNVRQATLDSMQASRMLRGFDGKALASQDYNGDGKLNDLAGDFDGDGTPDLGGPGVSIYASGESLGGIISEVQGGIDPNVSASASVSGGGGLPVDLVPRSTSLVENAVMLQAQSPLLIAIPATDRPPDSDGTKHTQCSATQRSVRWFVNDLTSSAEVEIACLNPDELAPQMTVVVENTSNKEVRCVRTSDHLANGTPDANGRFRVPIPANIGDPITIQMFNRADVVDSYKTCNVDPSAPLGRRIDTWEQAAISFGPVANPAVVCPSSATNGCQQFDATFFAVGDPLVAPQEGLGLSRQTPDLRRIIELLQAAFDPADPINYAPYYMMRPLLGADGKPVPPHALLSVDTVGDGFVDISTGTAFARAAGALPFFAPSGATTFPAYADYATPEALYDQWGATANRVLITNYEVEGVARLARAPAGPACDVNYSPSMTCTSPPSKDPTACQDALYDADWLSEGEQHYDQAHPQIPLRTARDATAHASDPASLAAAWGPRLAGVPFSADTAAWKNPVVALASVYFIPTGQHAFDAGDPCDAFDTSTYLNGTLARFLGSGGKDVYYISHPSSHRCLANQSCDFEK